MGSACGVRTANLWPAFAVITILAAIAGGNVAAAQEESHQPCRVEAADYEGWKAQQVSNAWVKLVIVPQIGGRVMQVYFNGHPYLFVNPKLKGQYLPPLGPDAKHRWFNYGGDKIWPMPEGDEDEHHWPGPVSDPLDDGDYAFRVLSTAPNCKVRLDGPPDPETGLQYSREITLDSDSAAIQFHAIMKNVANHPIEWSVQSVTQYDTKDIEKPGDYNREFWAYTPANVHSAYLEKYHVRAGLADDPSFQIKEGLFCLHWLPLENEVWIDSTAGWLAVVDAAAQYGMVENFHYSSKGEYPGKATVIFYKNGTGLTLNDVGFPALTATHEGEPLRYMEAELNSPIMALAPGETYAMDTEWHPVRIGKEIVDVTNAGVCEVALQATQTSNGIHLQGTFAAFFSGHLQADFADARGKKLKSVTLQSVSVETPVKLEQTIVAPATAARVSLHLIDRNGKDRGELGSASIVAEGKSS
jgi:hypothetical protein